MDTDTIISLIRLLRKAGVLDLGRKVWQAKLPIIIAMVLIAGGGYYALSGEESAPSREEVRNTTNVTAMEDPANGTVTFTLNDNQSVDSVRLDFTDYPNESVELTKENQTYTAPSNRTVNIIGVFNGEDILIRTHSPSEEAKSGENSTDTENNTLTAVIGVNRTSAPLGEPIGFTAENSTVPEAVGNVTYNWEFDDDTTETGVNVSHSYTETATYTVELTVTPEAGNASNVTQTINIGNNAPTAELSGDSRGKTTETFTFSARGSDDPERDKLSYDWQFGDGVNASGISVDHKYSSVGTFDVTLTVTDEWGATTSETFTVTTINSPPSAEADFPESGDAGNLLTFDASESSDPDGESLNYEWAFGDGDTRTGQQVQHSYASSGTYTVRLYVTDASGAETLYKGIINIDGTTSDDTTDDTGGNAGESDANAVEPTARISASSTADSGQPVTFDGSGSSDPNEDSLTYTWDFGDGQTGAGVTDENTFAGTGTYTVRLTVSDGNNSDTTSQSIDIQNSAPTANGLATPNPTHPTETVTFDASESSDPNGDTLTYEWKLGDGTTQTGDTIDHTYTETGTYDAQLTVTDPSGEADSDTFTVTVDNRPPTAVAEVNPQSATIDETLDFTASESTDPDGDDVTYEWNFNDGTANETTENVSHSFSEIGTYDVIVTVTDSNGESSSESVTVEIDNQAPDAVATANKSDTYVNEEIEFDGSASSDPEGQDLTYEWNFDDGVGTATGEVVTYTYQSGGSRTVTLTVTDSEGETSTTDVQVNITNRDPSADYVATPTTAYINEDIEFDPSGTSDPDGQDLTYDWDYANEDTATLTTNDTYLYQYNTPNTYNVTLRVTDAGGNKDIASQIITIENRAPTAVPDANKTTVTTGETIHFNGTDSSDPDGQDITYRWDFNDESEPVNRELATHSFDTKGTYLVQLTVYDGYDSDTATIEITVE